MSSAINFADQGALYVEAQSNEGNGFLPVDGVFRMAKSGSRIMWGRDFQAKGPQAAQARKRQVVFGYTTLGDDGDPEGCNDVPVSDYVDIDGMQKGTNKALAIQVIGNHLRNFGYSEAEVQANLRKLPSLPAVEDKAAEAAFCKALDALTEGRTAFALLRGTAKGDGSRLITVVDKMQSKAQYDSTKLSGNGYRNDQDREALEADRKAKAAAPKRGRGRQNATSNVSGAISGSIPSPQTQLDVVVS